jgi:hypothetical protein
MAQEEQNALIFLLFVAAQTIFSAIWRLSQLPVTGLQI